MKNIIERVRQIDPTAAEYLESGAVRQLPRFKEASDLRFMFRWSDSPQGSNYWATIYEQLGQQESEPSQPAFFPQPGDQVEIKSTNSIVWQQRTFVATDQLNGVHICYSFDSNEAESFYVGWDCIRPIQKPYAVTKDGELVTNLTEAAYQKIQALIAEQEDSV